MAERIEGNEYEFKRQGRSHFPEEWFDGNQWCLTGSDFNIEDTEEALNKKRQAIQQAAYRRGIKVAVNVDTENYDQPVMVVQFYNEKPGDLTAKKRRKKAS